MRQTTNFQISPLPARRRARQGQSAVVALLVLLLLGVVGALFITVVARNVVNARHANRVVNADYYAKAGITFADAQLTYSPDGADWRPPLQNTVAVAPTETREMHRYNAAVTANGLAAAAATDPDKAYLDQGFTRYTAGAGRFLLRLTYDPVNLNGASVPPGRYIKIEAIGREGVIDPLDPTTYANNQSSDRTQAYQVAYKPIGITDYARFETNLENRSDIANLGVVSEMYAGDPDKASSGTNPAGIATPGATDFTGSGTNYQLYPVVTTYGASDALLKNASGVYPNPTAGTGLPLATGSTPLAGGGSLRANMSTRFFGKNIAYMYAAGADAPTYEDTFEIAGNLLLDGYDPTVTLNNDTATATTGQRAALSLNPTNLTMPMQTGTLVSPSNAGMGTDVNPPFNTQNGLIRDGSGQTDANGLPRSINRLDPPLMDAPDPATSLPRYKALALASPPRFDPSTGVAYTGTQIAANGYGRSIYINNAGDIQPDSTQIGGGTTLTDEWLNTTNAATPGTFGGWNGDLYDPIGVNITLGTQTALIKGTTQKFAGIRLTRSDAQGEALAWKDPSGNALTGVAPDGTSQSTMYISYDSLNASNDLSTVVSGDNLNNDVLIYAEGSVRVHGIASPDNVPRHITIVTNGTAYIDGNVLKGTPDSSITILAHDYVCVNTTQFTAGPQQDTGAALTPAKVTGSDSFYSFSVPTDILVQELEFGLPSPTQQVGTATASPTLPAAYPSLALYVSAQAESGSASTTQADFNIVNAAGTNIYSSSPSFGAQTRSVFPISYATFPNVASLRQSDVVQLQINQDAAAAAQLLMERVAVLPMDIRIEAVMYAQTRSFFVIPGPSFNSDASDTLDTFDGSVTAGNPGGTRPLNTDSLFPLYGQPIDMKIVIDGAISESRPADINAQTAWMLRWGWIPQFHGSMIGLNNVPAEPAGHPGRIGLQMIYNPQAGYPYNPLDSNPLNRYYLRSDQYGRPLPFSPRLPVSTGLLYAGESGEAPILQ